ncbi:MAG: phosphogluconate dehydrogenase (NAD(+)-dependent, decarboxylating) [Dehalococcoidia bacterium]
MQVGLIGLGRMGSRIRDRLARGGHDVVAYDQDAAVSAVASIEALVAQLAAPRVVWVMVPSGAATDAVFATLEGLVAPGDLLVDGGNSDFRDSQARAERLVGLGVHFLDIGVSGGVYGGERGFCLMAGGAAGDFARIEPLAAALAAPDGYALVGPAGAGHYTKMCHNAIEYAIMEALGEGFDLLNHFDAPIDAHRVAELWNHGSVIRSWLLELAGQALAKDPDLSTITGYVEDSGEGRWAIREAVARGVPATGLAESLFRRFASREADSYATRLIAALRDEFGQHGTVARS